MRTIVFPPSGLIGFGRTRTAQAPVHPLSFLEASVIADGLADTCGIRIKVELGRVVHLYALGPVTTAQEVAALRAFAAVTDSRLAWHPAAS